MLIVLFEALFEVLRVLGREVSNECCNMEHAIMIWWNLVRKCSVGVQVCLCAQC